MFNPVVIPLPVGLAAVAALALATWWLRCWLETAYPLSFGPVQDAATAPKPPAGGRHRPGANRSAYSDVGRRQTLAEAFVMLPLPDAAATLPQRIPGDALAAAMEEAPFDFDALPDWEKDLYVRTPPAPDAGPRSRALPMPVPAPSWRDDLTTVFERPEGVAPPRHDDVSWANPGTHPAPCAYPDLLPCICSVQEPSAVKWFGVAEDETRELEPVQ